MSEIYQVLAGDSFGRYSKKLAKMAGLQTACYWSCVSNITAKVVKKTKYDEGGYFEVNRKYITEETSISEEDQLVCDKALRNLGVLDSDETNTNRIRVRADAMLSLLINADADEIKKISKVAKVSRADKTEGKRIGIINRLKGRVNEQDQELVDLYGQLIEACYSKGLTTNAQIDLYQETLNKFTTDVTVKKEIVRIGASCGYKLADWSIEQYEKKHGKKNVASRLGEQKVCKEVNKEIEF